MEKDVQALKDVNSLMIITFLNADLEMNEEADSRNKEFQNNEDYFNRQGQKWLCFFYSQLLISAIYSSFFENN